MNFNDVAIVTVKGKDYKILNWSKTEAINVLINTNLNGKSRTL